MPTFDEWLQQQDNSGQTATNLSMAVDANPQAAADAVKQARRNAIPPSLVGTQPDPDYTRRNKLEDAASAVQQAPSLEQWLNSQPQVVAAAVHDDLHNLSALDKALEVAKGSGKALYSSLYGFNEGFYGLVEAGGASLPDKLGDGIEQFGRNARLQAQAYKNSLMPQATDPLSAGWYSGLQSTGQMALTLPLALLSGNPVTGAAIMSGTAATTTAGQSFGQARDAGLDVAPSLTFATGQGLIEYLTEELPALKLFGDLSKGSGLGKIIRNQLATEIPGEQLATVMQDFNEWATLNPEKPFSEFMAERPEAALSTLVATLVGGGAMSATALGLDSVVRRVRGEDARVTQARQLGDTLRQLQQLAEATSTRERDVETLESFLQTATDNTPVEALYIDGRTLMESGLADQLAAASPAVASQLAQAQAGTMVRIPTAEVLGRFNQELAPLLPEMRTDPNGFTQREAEEFVRDRGPELQAEVERVLGASDQNATDQESRQRVRDTVASELMATGRVTREVADAYATLTGAFYHAMGKRMGKDAETLFNEERVRVFGEGQGELVQSQRSIQRMIALHGIEVENHVDAEAALSRGDRVYIMHEMDDYAFEAKSPDIIRQYQPDQMVIVRAGAFKQEPYETDIFGNELPFPPSRKTRAAKKAVAGGNIPAITPVFNNEAEGTYFTRTEPYESGRRELGIDVVRTPAEAAQAFAMLGKNTKESFNGLLTDDNGKPLALIGVTQGTVDAASVYNLQIVAEAFRVAGATKLWLGHNHPSGNPSLSRADENVAVALHDLFRGSSIEVQGILAVAGGTTVGNRAWSFASTPSLGLSTGATSEPAKQVSVPIIERQFTTHGIAKRATNPRDALMAAETVSDGKTGIMLLNNSHSVVGFIPMTAQQMGKLRGNGNMDVLFRALSMSNANAAVIVSANSEVTTDQAENVAGLFSKVHGNVVDVIDMQARESWSEKGNGVSGYRGFFQSVNNNAPRVATWFSGMRTLEAAIENLTSVMAVEFDAKINRFANKSWGTEFATRGVEEVDPQELKDANVTLFHASPVCKNFSAAKTLRGATDLDRKSAEAIARAITEARPPMVTVENVPEYQNTALFKLITDALDKAGYKWEVIVHNAADYGGAQNRERMLLRAVREGKLPPQPKKTGGMDWMEAISDLLPAAPTDTIPAEERRRLDEMIAQGKLDPSRPIITMGGSGFKGTWSAANDGGPAPTLKSAHEKPRIIMPDGTVRIVTPRMMARLMGLPDSFEVPDSGRFAKTVLGNGIHGNVTKALIVPMLEQHAAASSNMMGINVRNDGKAGVRYADDIVDGKKLYESRDTDSLRPYVGKRVAIVRTGEGPAKAIGEVTVGEPILVDEAKFREMQAQHLVPPGSAFDVKPGGKKYLYPMQDATRYDTERDVGAGIVARQVFNQTANRRERLRQLHNEKGVQFVDSTIDRGGAHTPSGPNSGSPAYDVALNGTYPEDFYSYNGLRYYGTGNDKMDAEAHSMLMRLAGRPNAFVTVYRAVEKDGPKKIQPGDWVTTVRAYAKEHGESALNGNYKIVKMLVHARDIYTSGDSMLEWGYHPQERMPEVPREQFNQSVSLRRGTQTLRKYGLDPSKKYKTREVAAALEARQREKFGAIAPDDRSPEAARKIAGWMTEEVMFAMENPEQSGVGWYSVKFQRAIDTFAKEFPELATDKTARDIFTILVAVTSDGQKVLPNFAQAADIYGNFRTSGKFTTSRGHARQASIDNNLQRIQQMHDSMGAQQMRDFLMQERTVRELKAVAKAQGKELKTAYQVDVVLPMAAVVLGPKLGAFYANLMGAHGYLTMDRWWSRTFNRYRGVLLQQPTRQGLDRFKELYAADKRLNRPPSEISDDEVLSFVVEYRNSYEAKGYKDGTEIEKAANTIYKMAFENLEDTPFNASDRTFMLDAVAKAASNLKRRGVNMSIADIQAVLWYYEKRLYGELGARQTADISYEEAASRVVEARASGTDLTEGPAVSGSDGNTAAGMDEGVSPGEEDFQPDEGDGELYQSAYHASPHRFQRFSLDHIGTGEGAQAYGWGLYFAESRGVGESYWRQFRDREDVEDRVEFRGKTFNPAYPDESDPDFDKPEFIAARWLALTDGDVDATLEQILPEGEESASPEEIEAARLVEQGLVTFDEITKQLRPPPAMYAVDIPDEAIDRMLDYDKPLAEQSDYIKQIFIRQYGQSEWKSVVDQQATGKEWYATLEETEGSDKEASLFLSSLGIPGLKYLDHNSRITGNGTRNIVLWDQAVIDKMNETVNTLRQKQDGEARGSFSPSQLAIRLNKAQNLSTFLHESGHFYLHMLVNLAVRPDAPADIKADAETALRWMGIEEEPGLSLFDTWLSMSIEQQTEGHERFARGFEVYLQEGKAPSAELEGVFSRFRAWLINVYKQLMDAARSVNRTASFGQAMRAPLSDEVRAVFDRMLATEDEIKAAQAARSMGMMFASAEEAAKFGIDWQAYQEHGQAATDAAVSDLDAQRIRNMKWLANARSRLLKKLQKDYKDIRLTVHNEARAEAMSIPAYQAWEFLTTPLKDSDRERWKKIAKSANVQPDTDSLLTAIAKLGGLQVDEVESQWGFDPADMRSASDRTGLGNGKPVARRKDGKSIEAMAELLADLGYIAVDENGKHDLTDFHDKLENGLMGRDHYSNAADWTLKMYGPQDETLTLDFETGATGAWGGRFDYDALIQMMGSESEFKRLMELGMVRKSGGDHPDAVAEAFGFSSGEELVRDLMSSRSPHDYIEGLTDAKMMERYSELATPQAREDAVNRALATQAAAKVQATELAALEKAMSVKGKGKNGRTQNTLPSAAKSFAEQVIARLVIREIRPSQFTGSASRAGRAASKAAAAGNLQEAALEKRNQLVNTYAARAASEAMDEVERGVSYLKKFDNDGTRKNLDLDYLEQIDAILERYELKRVSNKGLDKRKALSEWIAEQEAMGITPDLPPHVSDAAKRANYRELSVEEFRGLVESIKQIEHFARLKKKLLLAKDKRKFQALMTDLKASIAQHAGNRTANNTSRGDVGSLVMRGLKMFTAAHRKVASLAYQADGFQDGGPLWETLVRTANEQSNWEATQQAEMTSKLASLLKALPRAERPFSKGRYFAGVRMSLTQEMRLTVALNWGNEGNRQRLMSGRNWSMNAVQEVLDSLTQEEWQFVQGVWDAFESLRPAIAEKERRVMGKEPNWVQATPVTTPFGQLRGGYFPIVYDPRENLKAEENDSAEAAKRQLQGARSAATTRRNFVKARAAEVTGRPVLLTMDGMFRGLTDVIHDLAFHEWLIDANRVMRAIDQDLRDTYGAEFVQQFRSSIEAIAAGEATKPYPLDPFIRHVRVGSMVAGLGFNLVNAALQPLGITQSIVRIGAKWVVMGAAKYAANPAAAAREVLGKSEFMRNRKRTQNRELNDLRNRIRGRSEARQKFDALLFLPMTAVQMTVDYPTWLAAYEKSQAEGHDDDTAVQIADQAVIASQGGGQIKDLAAIQRGPEMAKVFTVFYGYFSTAYNLGAERYQATSFRSPAQVFNLAADFLLLYGLPAAFGLVIKEAFAGGDDDEDELADKLKREQISYLFSLMVGVREFTGAAQMLAGSDVKGGASYGGPAGLRFMQEVFKFSQQVNQGDADLALLRSGVNVAGIATHLPSAQINRTIDGVVAISEGRTQNPVDSARALVAGAPR